MLLGVALTLSSAAVLGMAACGGTAPTAPSGGGVVAVQERPFISVPLFTLLPGQPYKLTIVGYDLTTGSQRVPCSPLTRVASGKYVDTPVTVAAEGGEWVARASDGPGDSLELRFRAVSTTPTDPGPLRVSGTLRGTARNAGGDALGLSRVSVVVGSTASTVAVVDLTGGGPFVGGTASGFFTFSDGWGVIGTCSEVDVLLRPSA